MDLPVNAKVQCSDGPAGRSTYLVFAPQLQQVTHLVVRQEKAPHTEFLVPIDQVENATPTTIQLRCKRLELEAMTHFIDREYVRVSEHEQPDKFYVGEQFPMLHYSILAEHGDVCVNHENIPEEELAVKSGAQVEATDGRVGRVDEFLVNPENGRITHVVMREGHFWGQKEVAIPIAHIERIGEKTVYLKLDKAAVHQLPAIPVRRWVKEKTHDVE